METRGRPWRGRTKIGLSAGLIKNTSSIASAGPLTKTSGNPPLHSYLSPQPPKRQRITRALRPLNVALPIVRRSFCRARLKAAMDQTMLPMIGTALGRYGRGIPRPITRPGMQLVPRPARSGLFLGDGYVATPLRVISRAHTGMGRYGTIKGKGMSTSRGPGRGRSTQDSIARCLSRLNWRAHDRMAGISPNPRPRSSASTPIRGRRSSSSASSASASPVYVTHTPSRCTPTDQSRCTML